MKSIPRKLCLNIENKDKRYKTEKKIQNMNSVVGHLTLFCYFYFRHILKYKIYVAWIVTFQFKFLFLT